MAPMQQMAIVSTLDATSADAGTGKPRLEPPTQRFIDPSLRREGRRSTRCARSDAQGAERCPGRPNQRPPADIDERKIPVGPKGWTRIHIVRPQGVEERLPVVMYFHGGGWILGGFDTHRRLIRAIACGTRAAVVLVDYPAAPEQQYPVQIEEDYAVTKYRLSMPTSSTSMPAASQSPATASAATWWPPAACSRRSAAAHASPFRSCFIR
jgi:acetyl esterase